MPLSLRRTICNRQFGFEPWICRLRDLFILGNKSGQMFTKSGLRNLSTEGCFGGSLATYRCKTKRHVAVCLSVTSQTRPLLTVIIRPRESHVVMRPKYIRILWDSARWTKIRAFFTPPNPSVWFSQLVWTFKKLNSSYLGRQHSRFGQWNYFSIRREDLFFCMQAEQVSSDARHTLFGTLGWGGHCIVVPRREYSILFCSILF